MTARDQNPKFTQLHFDTASALNGFMGALRDKLIAAQVKHGVTDEWRREDWKEECQEQLQEHVDKGDPRDVAIYALFCWARGWKTSEPNGVDVSSAGERNS